MKDAGLPKDRVERWLVAHAPANDDQPEEMGTSDQRLPTDWSTLALLGAAGVVVLGCFGGLAWAIWKVVTLPPF